MNVIKLNSIIADDKQLQCTHEKWIKNNSKGYLLALEPYQGRYLSALYFCNLLPSFLNKDKCYRIMNYINCEAHLDRLIYMLKYRIYD